MCSREFEKDSLTRPDSVEEVDFCEYWLFGGGCVGRESRRDRRGTGSNGVRSVSSTRTWGGAETGGGSLKADSGRSVSPSSTIVSVHLPESLDVRPSLYSAIKPECLPEAESASTKLWRWGRSWYSSVSRAYEANWELLSLTPWDEYWGVSGGVVSGANGRGHARYIPAKPCDVWCANERMGLRE